MIGKKNWKLIGSTCAILILSLAVTALAHGFSRGGRGEHGGLGNAPPSLPGFGHFGRLVDQLLKPCRNDCLSASRSCNEAADSAAVACAKKPPCDASIQTALAACTASRSSQACRDDLTALRTCIQPCVDTESTVLMGCRTTLLSCLSTCAGTTATPTPTPGS